MRRASRGVALILVLMITAVLGLLMLQLGLTAKDHTNRAQRLVDRATADVRLRSVQSALLFELATRPWEKSSDFDASTFPGEFWNFGGRSFKFLEANVSIQDMSGLIPFPQPGESAGRLAQMLRAVGVPADQARRAADNLAVMQSPPVSMPLQDPYELGVVGGLSPAQVRRVSEVGTIYPTGSFNPATATPAALAALYSGSALEGLRDLRARDDLDRSAYRAIAGEFADETALFYPGPGFRISTRVSFGVAVADEDLTVTIDPYSPAPFSFWSRRRPENKPAENTPAD